MRRVSENKPQLIAVELGAEWPSWLDQPGSGPRRVISELEAETPAVFAARVTEELARELPALAGAVLLCNERADATQTQARLSLVRALLAATVDKKSVALTVAAPGRASKRFQQALSELVSELGRRAAVRYDSEADANTVSRVA